MIASVLQWFWCWPSDWSVSSKPPSESEMFLPLRSSKEKCCGIKVNKKTNNQEPAEGGNLEEDNTGLHKFILPKSYNMLMVKTIVLWHKFNTNEFIFLFSELFCLFSMICAENKPWNWKHVQQQKCLISHFIINPKLFLSPLPYCLASLIMLLMTEPNRHKPPNWQGGILSPPAHVAPVGSMAGCGAWRGAGWASPWGLHSPFLWKSYFSSEESHMNFLIAQWLIF